jgi:hypothetical protein
VILKTQKTPPSDLVFMHNQTKLSLHEPTNQPTNTKFNQSSLTRALRERVMMMQ